MGTPPDPDTTFFIVEDHDWADDAATASVPAELLEEARRRGGGGRKLMAQGEGGFQKRAGTLRLIEPLPDLRFEFEPFSR